MRNIFSIKVSIAVAAALILIPSMAFAHVVVRPDSVGIGKYQTFTMSVPSEGGKVTTALRVVIPEGMASITPTVKPGWKIETKKTGEGEDATTTEISWGGGTIPAAQRDDFTFSAKTPSTETELHWKAYQTYEDGTVVAWDQEPSQKNPYSVTKIVNDLASEDTATEPKKDNSSKLAITISFVALALSILALSKRTRTVA